MNHILRRHLMAGAIGAAVTVSMPLVAAAQNASTIVIAQAADAYSMDPAKHSAFPTANILFQIYDGLVTQNEKGEIAPALATSWSNPDPLTWRFKLREGVKFHNDEVFNAAAVKYTFDRALDPNFKAPYYSRISQIKAVNVVDDYTIDIKTAKPFPTMLLSLYEASFPALIVPPTYTAQSNGADLGAKPVGTGPYRFVEWKKDERVVLEANPDYWGGKPAITKVIFRPIKETRTRIAELKSEGVDIAVDVPPEDIASLEGGDTKVVSVPSEFLYFLAFDTTRDTPLKDKRVRQAINYAVDVNAIQEALLNGMGTRIALTLPSNAFGYDAAWKPYPYDPTKAKALLAEAGYPNGFTIPLMTRKGRYMKDSEIVEATAGFLSKVGIKANIQYLEPGVWGQVSEKKGREGITFPGWSGRDPNLVWAPLLHTGEYQSYYSNPDLDKLLDAGAATIDPAERKSIYTKAAAIIKDDAPHLPMVQPPLIYGLDKKLSWTPRADGMIDLRKAHY
ncbi:ABC transporter substrate-binding protein [Neorhizobium galegae]|uniref:ABC transporter substrate-binding protein n=1 Tax=Neorhizobium galegae TaxID=399 RepID=UPI0009BB4CB4|nr:ABC transporter substrate-binding protein [Neorhizobium galegae]KAB1121209.1 ABC transporter substrate-binding protein [Neorhizobium galegae]MCQ1571620.1 ABC transporter substrate-binding protein [Neorhizobium galegae]MCQ1807381.1 ABC transporter substrate-binding protein [Neorhizobium galegae]MCQ1837755.1 ABC transporter substrate-binding protein [Neorhizobium galegae]UIY31501.1 ABC transporter substrate-binding protein [Neorhizobium galegae]